MTREIKFRFWSKILKKYVIPDDMVLAGAFKDKNMIVQQYTGLKDKNGKEIFIGDIIKIHNYKTEWKNGEPEFDWRIFEIFQNRYTVGMRNNVCHTPLTDYNPKASESFEIELLGNIYENPELVKFNKEEK